MPEPKFRPGDTVAVAIHRAGPSNPPVVGELLGIVLHGRSEYDVILHPGMDEEEADDILLASDGTSVKEYREGPVVMLRNCQPEHMSLINPFPYRYR